MNNNWRPEICYEDYNKGAESFTSGIPFIDVPKEHNMPTVLFVYESRKIENDSEEVEREIVLHSYANMMHLKDKLLPEVYDIVRVSLGLKPLKEATNMGNQINQKINKNIL